MKDLDIVCLNGGGKRKNLPLKNQLLSFCKVSFVELFLLNPLELSAQRSNFNVAAATYFKLKLPEEEKQVFGFSL